MALRGGGGKREAEDAVCAIEFSVQKRREMKEIRFKKNTSGEGGLSKTLPVGERR